MLLHMQHFNIHCIEKKLGNEHLTYIYYKITLL